MSTTPFWRPAATLALGGASLLGALSAHAAFNPPIHMASGIEYMSGGISSDEAALMETVAPPLAELARLAGFSSLARV